MAAPKDTQHINNLIQNIVEVSNLLTIHGKITKPGPGKKHDVQILHKSAVVLLVACWEAYVEDLVQAALGFMTKNCTDHRSFPKSVLERIASKNSGIDAWNLAGDGWKVALQTNLKEVLARTIGTLNTPKTTQVDELFKKSLGIDPLSSCWYWKGRSIAQTTEALDALVTLRGSIAHRVTASASVQKKDVLEARDLISRLAARSSNHVRIFVHKQIGKYPWSAIKYQETA